jgi:hypothetical protein
MSKLSVAVLAVAFVALPGLAWALEDVITLTPQQAVALGMIVRAKASGSEAVSVELAFATTGALQKYERVELTIRDGKKLVVFTRLKEEAPMPGHVSVYFIADRAKIPECTLKVVTQDGLSRIGRVLPMKDFVNVADDR